MSLQQQASNIYSNYQQASETETLADAMCDIFLTNFKTKLLDNVRNGVLETTIFTWNSYTTIQVNGLLYNVYELMIGDISRLIVRKITNRINADGSRFTVVKTDHIQSPITFAPPGKLSVKFEVLKNNQVPTGNLGFTPVTCNTVPNMGSIPTPDTYSTFQKWFTSQNMR